MIMKNTRKYGGSAIRSILGSDYFFILRIPCSDSTWSYVVETGRCFGTRRNKHIRRKMNTILIFNIGLLVHSRSYK